MNYKESTEILKKVLTVKNILINCHRNPDGDSAGSALALKMVLEKLGKEVQIICPSEPGEHLNFLPHAEDIKKVDFSEFDFGKFDIFLILDTAGVNMLTGKVMEFKVKIPTIAIDHHITNTKFADLNLIDDQVTSTSELLYGLFEDWNISLDKDLSTCLFAGIVTDSGSFSYGKVGARTFAIASELVEKGAEKKKILESLLHSYDFKTLILVGELIKRANFDSKNNFIHTEISFKELKKFKSAGGARDLAVDFLVQTKNILFAMVLVEMEEKVMSVSLRSRGEFDVSKIALNLGGGGHKQASGAKIEKLIFEKAVEKALKAAIKSINENK